MADKDLGELTENFEEEVENLKNTKMKIFGITMTPTTIGAAFAILSSIVGGLYASFQVYDDYMGMKEIVENIDVDSIQTRNNEIETLVGNVKTELEVQISSIQKQIDDLEKRTRENKVDTRDQINTMDSQVRRVEKLVRDTESDVRQIIQNAEERFDNKRDALQNQYDNKAAQLRESSDSRMTDLENKMERDMKILESTLNNKLQRALDNPLAN
jgi:hypothetical protein